VNLGLASQSKIGPIERDHCTLCKASEEGQFYKGAASQNSQNLTERSIPSKEALRQQLQQASKRARRRLEEAAHEQNLS